MSDTEQRKALITPNGVEDSDDEMLETTQPTQYGVDDDKYQHIKTASVAVPETQGDPPMFSFRTLWAFTGPGWLMSIAYLDPGNIESDLQAGAVAGYKLMWVLLWATIFGLLFQILSARLGVTTGRNLAQTCRESLSKPIKLTIWIMIELAIIASDVQEVIGSAIAIYFLSNGRIKLYQGCLITAADTFTFLFLERFGLRKLEALFASLIVVMSVSFGYMYVKMDPPQGEVVASLFDFSLSNGIASQAVAVIGAVIMPHNLYLHSALVTSRAIKRSSDIQVSEANKYNAIESTIALGVSFVINLFVVSVFAEAFYGRPDAQDIDLFTSGQFLELEFGKAMKYIWALGLLAAGQSSTMTGTYAGQFVMEGFLKLNIKPWKRVALTRTLAMVPTVAIAAASTPAILNQLNEWMNVLQSFQLPFALLPLVHFCCVPGIMGKRVLTGIAKYVSWAVCLLLIATNYYLIVISLQAAERVWYIDTIASLLVVCYTLFVLYLLVGPMLPLGSLRTLYQTEIEPVEVALHEDADILEAVSDSESESSDDEDPKAHTNLVL
eukprot:m.360086 g.360086  ORF g.360086 m.360086 type:complete len:552 (-) comp18868_c0_seq1:168-1823(-)